LISDIAIKIFWFRLHHVVPPRVMGTDPERGRPECLDVLPSWRV
jgi:hypothetical protein